MLGQLKCSIPSQIAGQYTNTLSDIFPQFYTPKLCSEYKFLQAIEITSMKSETAGSMMIKGHAL